MDKQFYKDTGEDAKPAQPTMSGSSRIHHSGISSANTDRHPAQQLLETVPFNLVFRAEDGTDVKTDTILSQDLSDKLKPEDKKGATPLSKLREKGKL